MKNEKLRCDIFTKKQNFYFLVYLSAVGLRLTIWSRGEHEKSTQKDLRPWRWSPPRIIRIPGCKSPTNNKCWGGEGEGGGGVGAQAGRMKGNL